MPWTVGECLNIRRDHEMMVDFLPFNPCCVGANMSCLIIFEPIPGLTSHEFQCLNQANRIMVNVSSYMADSLWHHTGCAKEFLDTSFGL